ncbi:MAG: uroporphyrinogen-III C-methyltransferase [Wenzhouxiangellaceae bacterium]
MSENDAQDTPQKSQVHEDAAETGDGPDPAAGPDEPAAEKKTFRRRRAGVVAWLALLLAVGAAGLASEPYWSQWLDGEDDDAAATAMPTAGEFKALSDHVDRIDRETEQAREQLRQGLTDLEAELEAATPAQDLSERVDRLGTRLERLEGDSNTRLGGIRSRIEDLEEQVGRRLEQFELRLAEVGTDLDRADHDLATRLRLVEVDSLFALAQDQLTVSANAQAARTAWQRGLERLAVLEGDEFRDLKDAARGEFEALRAFQPPDTAAHVDRIYAIIAEIEQWPARSGPAQTPADSDAPAGDWRERLGSVLDGLVTIENVDGDYLSPAEVDLAREQLRISLQAAALAVVRTSDDTARRLVERALASAERYFDTDAAVVGESVAWLSDLAARDGREIRTPSLEDSRAEIARLLGSVR